MSMEIKYGFEKTIFNVSIDLVLSEIPPILCFQLKQKIKNNF
jgi:hypothetical protein